MTGGGHSRTASFSSPSKAGAGTSPLASPQSQSMPLTGGVQPLPGPPPAGSAVFPLPKSPVGQMLVQPQTGPPGILMARWHPISPTSPMGARPMQLGIPSAGFISPGGPGLSVSLRRTNVAALNGSQGLNVPNLPSAPNAHTGPMASKPASGSASPSHPKGAPTEATQPKRSESDGSMSTSASTSQQDRDNQKNKEKDNAKEKEKDEETEKEIENEKEADTEKEKEMLSEEMRVILRKIDVRDTGIVSEWDLIDAVRRHPDVAALVVPDAAIYRSAAAMDEDIFDAVNELLEEAGNSKRCISCTALAAHLKDMSVAKPIVVDQAQRIFSLIDAHGKSRVSVAGLLNAVQRSPEVSKFVLPNTAIFAGDQACEEVFAAVGQVFGAISGGRRCFDFFDFKKYFQRLHALTEGLQLVGRLDRSTKKVLIIGPGFGRGLNPQQGKLVDSAGYQEVRWCWEGLPNPETPNFNVQPYLPIIKASIDQFQPDVIASASKGGAYMVGLWAAGLWQGPTLLINAHPCCRQFPKGAPVVLCQGSNDEIYPTPRSRLEELVATGSENMCMLYHTANSGLHQSGQFSRFGDRHNMVSLVVRDCLPRLLDAVMSPQGPEPYFLRTWRDFLSEERLSAERWLGYAPEVVQRHWSSQTHRGSECESLVEVQQETEEFEKIAVAFKAHPREIPSYNMSPAASWDCVQIKKVERIQNSALHKRCTSPYYESIKASIEDQGMQFEPGVHTCWAFHGTDPSAVDSICTDPISGFQPLSSGSRGASLWGLGTYFARDARYVRDGGFCGQPANDGTRKMLMCLLMTGMPCLGDPQHRGVLPVRQRPHRYHSSVDCVSSPEVYIIQQSGAAHAAYLITYK